MILAETISISKSIVQYIPGGIYGLFIGSLAVLFVVTVFIIYALRVKLLLRWYQAIPIKDEKIKKTVEKLSEKARLNPPKVYLIPSVMSNAFSIGKGPKNACLILTTSLIDLLNEEELNFVIAHEFYHIKNGLHQRTVAATFAGIFGGVHALALWTALLTGFGQEDDPAPRFIQSFAKALSAPYTALLVNLSASPMEEFRADTYAYKLCENPDSLANALVKMSKSTYDANPGHTHLFFTNPLKRDTFNSLFQTHPTIEERIKALIGAGA